MKPSSFSWSFVERSSQSGRLIINIDRVTRGIGGAGTTELQVWTVCLFARHVQSRGVLLCTLNICRYMYDRPLIGGCTGNWTVRGAHSVRICTRVATPHEKIGRERNWPRSAGPSASVLKMILILPTSTKVFKSNAENHECKKSIITLQ